MGGRGTSSGGGGGGAGKRQPTQKVATTRKEVVAVLDSIGAEPLKSSRSKRVKGMSRTMGVYQVRDISDGGSPKFHIYTEVRNKRQEAQVAKIKAAFAGYENVTVR